MAERLNTVTLNPEMCSLNMGLMNFFIRGEQVFFSNHRSDILRFACEMQQRGVKPELEVYNMAMLEEAEYLISTGLLEKPYMINFVLETPTQAACGEHRSIWWN
ncbi:MAG: 3-keto-5-aminohexanoate cleavage protein [Chloroflexaceae bacterium]|nr:3-keto-5-aminohexanoate cleavage protein [Chloroflexaceae bacterium]